MPRIRNLGRIALAIALAGVLAYAQAPGRIAGEKYALLIAVSQYEPSELRSLKYTETDVEGLAEVLVKAGYPAENIRVMTQTRGAGRARLLPTAAHIRTELALLLKNMEERDRVVIALAGHGVQLSGGEESYFCPADARLGDRSTLIPLSQVYAALEQCGAGSKVLLVDACRNDPLTAQARDAGRAVVDFPSLTRPLKKRPLGGIAALFSCSGGERAFEHPELKHGVFFHFVLQGLQGEADLDGDGKVDFDELAVYTKRRVYRFVANEYQVEQTPELVGKSNLLELVSVARARIPDVPAPVPPAVPGTITNTVGMKLARIPSGEFLMGSPDSDKDAQDDEKPQHRVRITRPFYLGTTEVTEGQYRAVTGANPSEFKGSDDLPVEQVSWNDALAFCNKLSEREGLKPYYQFGTGAQSGGDGYRLPTEAEWEYACRAGSTTRYSFGDDATPLGAFAWFAGNSERKIHPVGQKRANAWGLHDMSGNVWEWCWDAKDNNYYRQSPGVDPLGFSGAAFRVYRGGSCHSSPGGCWSAYRTGLQPGYRSNDVGFRAARVQSGR